jgi:hypothetical protein
MMQIGVPPSNETNRIKSKRAGDERHIPEKVYNLVLTRFAAFLTLNYCVAVSVRFSRPLARAPDA